MKLTALVLAALVLLVAGCGGEDEAETTAAPMAAATAEAVKQDDRAEKKDGDAMARKGTEVVLDGSDFGDMLYDSDKQAIYVFELDGRDRTECFGDCLEAWPPVLTRGEPVAGEGVDEKLLGTIERPEGGTQVTYAGRPLYYYAHEAPGEVRCHNVDLNGGLWWVVGADGEALA